MNIVRRLGLRILIVDGLVALVLGALILTASRFAAMNQVPARHPLDELAYALLALAAAALMVRRTWPVATLALTTGAITAYLAFEYPYGPVFITIIIGSYSVASREPLRRSLIACGVAFLVLFMGHFSTLGWAKLFPEALFVALWATGLLVAPWAIGMAVRLSRESHAQAREDETRQRAYEERLRVVQEVHDVVGHGLSAINLQSGVALHVLDKQPEQARPTLEAIRQTSKDALDELRATLAVFRAPEGAEERAPSPGLEQLGALVERMNQAGLTVRCSSTGEPNERPATVDLAAYRIVQESLTNVLRHAGLATATVQVGYQADAVDVEITDNGVGTTASSPEGHGITGMHHRASAVGGTLEAGPRPQGGYRVHAHLPFKKGRS